VQLRCILRKDAVYLALKERADLDLSADACPSRNRVLEFLRLNKDLADALGFVFLLFQPELLEVTNLGFELLHTLFLSVLRSLRIVVCVGQALVVFAHRLNLFLEFRWHSAGFLEFIDSQLVGIALFYDEAFNLIQNFG
jgi:hypothetical protein